MDNSLSTLRTIPLATLLSLTILAALPGNAQASDPLAAVKASDCPVVLLQHWQQSTQEEKLAFLFGFSTMLEMEKEWQGVSPLPINRSLAGIWVRGLDGVTFGQMCRTLDEYAASNPQDADKPILEILGRTYIRPKMSQEEQRRAAERYQEIISDK